MATETFTDPPGIEDADAEELLADDLERAAIALYNMGHMVPEDVGVLVARNDALLVKAWRGPGMGQPERHLYRRRAAMLLAVHAGSLRGD